LKASWKLFTALAFVFLAVVVATIVQSQTVQAAETPALVEQQSVITQAVDPGGGPTGLASEYAWTEMTSPKTYDATTFVEKAIGPEWTSLDGGALGLVSTFEDTTLASIETTGFYTDYPSGLDPGPGTTAWTPVYDVATKAMGSTTIAIAIAIASLGLVLTTAWIIRRTRGRVALILHGLSLKHPISAMVRKFTDGIQRTRSAGIHSTATQGLDPATTTASIGNQHVLAPTT